MEMFLKKSYKLMFKFDVYFRNIEVSITLIRKSFFSLCRKVLDAVCTHVTSLTASRDSAVKLMTDSYPLKPSSKFSIAYTVCKKSAKIW